LGITIIMPALNEERNIEKAVSNSLRALADYGIDGEVLVINDGSRDATQAKVEAIRATGAPVSLLNHEKPWGFGASFWDGVDHAQKDVVVVMPGDNENDPWEILRYAALLDHVDIVIPFVFNKKVRSLFRRVLSVVYRTVINLTFKTNLNYTNGTILYRRSILTDLPYRSGSFFFQTDILIRLLNSGYLFAEVPYRLDQRKDGVSKAVSFPSFVKVVKGYLKLIKDQYGHQEEVKPLRAETMTASRHTRTNEKFET